MKEVEQDARRVQPDQPDGRLRRPRLARAGAPARRHARPDVQALGRGHRDADHGELPRRPVGAAVLHLDPRRPQGPRRHGAQDRRLRLPDPPSGRRGAGRHHQRGRLRHDRRHLRVGDHGGRRDPRAAARPHRRPRQPGGHLRSDDRRADHRRRPGDHRDPRQRRPGGRHRAGEDPLGADLRDAARRVRRLLRPQPGDRQDGRDRRGGGRHRRAVDRRARHAAHHADLPLRRHREPRLRAVEARRQEPGPREVPQRRHGREQARRPGRRSTAAASW